ncbi:hypothetical protein ACQFX6_39435 [Streptomyces sp. DSM 41987]|uniref:hypothetical protein n=1 Tax=Streptomyces TaxID=1883 RepID=UPI00362368F4
MAIDLPYPVNVVTVDIPRREDPVAHSWTVWGDPVRGADAALSSLSVRAAGLGAQEAIGVRLLVLPMALMAYGTAIRYA